MRRPPDRTALGAGAVAEYREAGWDITPHGRVDAEVTVGPCAVCTEPIQRYGAEGGTLCGDCLRALTAERYPGGVPESERYKKPRPVKEGK